MKSPFAIFCVLLPLVVPFAWAQTSGGNSAGTLADNPPAVNARGGAVQQRAPGRLIDFARARHLALRDARLAAQRTGDTFTLAPEPSATGGASGVGNLLSNLLGGISPSLINSFLGTGLGGTGTGNTGSTGGNTSGLPPEVLQMIAAAGIDISGLNLKSNNNDAATTTGEQPKESSRAQQPTNTVQEERDFVVRWAEAMLSTVFTSLAIAVQTTDFIDLIKDLFRPLFNLESPEADASDGTTPSSRFNRLRGAYAAGVGTRPLLC